MEFHKLSKLGMLGGQPNKVIFTKSPIFLPDLVLALDSSLSSTVTRDAADKASQWDDIISGLNNRATQGIEVDQPIFTANGIGNQTALDYDGISDRMGFDSDVALAADWSLFMVLNTDDTGNVRMALGHDTFNIKIGIVSPNKLFVRTQALGSSDTTQTFASGDSILYLTRDTSDKVDQAFNGAPLNRLFSDVAQGGNTIFNRIGNDEAGFFWDGDIGEILIYNRALSTGEVSGILNELSPKWGIPLA